MPDRVIVEVDEDLSDLIPGFLTHKRDDVDTIFDAVVASRLRGDRQHRASDQGRRRQLRLRLDDRDGSRDWSRPPRLRDDSAVTTLARQFLSYLDHVEVVFQPSSE